MKCRMTFVARFRVRMSILNRLRGVKERRHRSRASQAPIVAQAPTTRRRRQIECIRFDNIHRDLVDTYARPD
jgi:hypothetical protein